MVNHYWHTILIQLTPANDSYHRSLGDVADDLDYMLGDHIGDLNRNTAFLWEVKACHCTKTTRNNITIPAIKGEIGSRLNSFEVCCEHDTLKLMDSLVYLYDDLAKFKKMGFNVKFSLKSTKTYCTYEGVMGVECLIEHEAKKTTTLVMGGNNDQNKL